MFNNKFISFLKKILSLMKFDKYGIILFIIALIGVPFGVFMFLNYISNAVPIYDNNILVKIKVVDWNHQAYILFTFIMSCCLGIFGMFMLITYALPIKFRSDPIKQIIIKILLLVIIPTAAVFLGIGLFKWVTGYSYKREITFDKKIVV